MNVVTEIKALKMSRSRRRVPRWAGLWVCIAAAVLITGCKKRDAVTPTVGIDSPERTWVRVLLFGNLREWTLETPAGFTAEGIGNGEVVDFSDSTALHMELTDGRIRVGEHLLSSQVLLVPNDPYYFVLNGEGFRGNLKLLMNDDGESVMAVNYVPLESYLLGVIGAEMHSYWEPEALKAQAVAARTYCLSIQHRFGAGRDWDIARTQANQMYSGLSAENSRVRQAVLDTTGQILIGPDANGNEWVFPAYYSSSCGGHTEESRYVFGDDLVPLPGVACPWCESVARHRDFFWEPVFYSMDQVSERLMMRYASLQRLERITDVDVIREGAAGRITQVRLTGANGRTSTLRGEDFRLSLDPTGRRLKSILATMTKIQDGLLFENGRGFGHGVGLCQCGAQGQARQGRSYREILSFYYPASRLVTIETSAAP